MQLSEEQIASTTEALLVVGARPQFIKAAMLNHAIAEHNESHPLTPVNPRIVHTGQHYDSDMSQVFFDELRIQPPAVNLHVGSGHHGEVTAAMLVGLEREILAHSPDIVIVFGDANSALAGALAAAKLHVPVAHVEAGLRSFNRRMPEEINRVITDHISQYLFCSSARSRALLARENITAGVHVVGDIMCDAFRQYRDNAIPPKITGPFALASIHRAGNTDMPERLCGILSAMGSCPVPVILPLHPRTRNIIEREKIAVNRHITIIEPLSYFSMIGHLAACAFVITDSGGLQKEAYFSGKKCITTREQTEWAELVECGANRVVGTDPQTICAAYDWAATPFDSPPDIYGDGTAAKRIVQQLTSTRS